jgi:hypothetical protein
MNNDMRKTIFLIIACLFASYGYGQSATVSIDDHVEPAGTISIPVEGTNLNDVGAISIFFEYDPALLSFIGYQDIALTGMEANSLTIEGTTYIGITWTVSGSNGVDVPDGTLITINFNYTGASSGDFVFNEAISEIVDNSFDAIPTLYINGSIAPASTIEVEIPHLQDQLPGTQINVPINVDFSEIIDGVGAFDFVVDFDAAVLQYQSMANTALSAITVDILSPSRIAFSWVNPNPAGSQLNGKLLDMVFDYVHGYSDLSFVEELCSAGDNNALDLNANYTNGSVSPLAAETVFVTAGTVEGVPGQEVLVPVTVSNFEDIGAFDLLIGFDPLVLDFLGLENIHQDIDDPNLESNVLNGHTVGINWTGNVSLDPETKLFDLRFDYFANESDLVFDAQESEVTGTDLSTRYVDYTDGYVYSDLQADVSVSLPDVLAQPNSQVEMPFTVVGFENIGAFDFQLTYDPLILESPQLTNVLADLDNIGDLDYNVKPGVISIGWNINASEPEGLTVPEAGKLFDLEFLYISGSSAVEFDLPNCEVSDFDIENVAVDFINGSVSGGIEAEVKVFLEGLYNAGTGQMNKAQDHDGTAPFDMFPDDIADQITIELHASGNYGTPVESFTEVNLLQDGTASFAIPTGLAGSYYITIKHRNHLETVSANPIDFTDLTLAYDFTTAAAQAYGSNQKSLSGGVFGIYGGDVNGDGVLTGADLVAANANVRAGSAGYIATDTNGDGVMTGADLVLINGNVRAGIASQTP